MQTTSYATPSARILGEYKSRIKKKIDEISLQTIHGTCDNFSEYRFNCGVAVGLDVAFEVYESLIKELIDKDDM